jgi:hypothetical protein
MVLDRIVQQCGADDIGVADAVVADDADGDPQQMIDVGLVLPPVGRVQPRRQTQRLRDALAVSRGERGCLDRQALPQPCFAVDGGDGV